MPQHCNLFLFDKSIKKTNQLCGRSLVDEVNHMIQCLAYYCMCHMCDVGLYFLLNGSLMLFDRRIYDLIDCQLNCLRSAILFIQVFMKEN